MKTNHNEAPAFSYGWPSSGNKPSQGYTAWRETIASNKLDRPGVRRSLSDVFGHILLIRCLGLFRIRIILFNSEREGLP